MMTHLLLKNGCQAAIAPGSIPRSAARTAALRRHADTIEKGFPGGRTVTPSAARGFLCGSTVKHWLSVNVTSTGTTTLELLERISLGLLKLLIVASVFTVDWLC